MSPRHTGIVQPKLARDIATHEGFTERKLDAVALVFENRPRHGCISLINWTRARGAGRRNLRMQRFRGEKRSPHSLKRCSRNELAITDTELKLIAALAIIGESSNPMNG